MVYLICSQSHSRSAAELGVESSSPELRSSLFKCYVEIGEEGFCGGCEKSDCTSRIRFL